MPCCHLLVCLSGSWLRRGSSQLAACQPVLPHAASAPRLLLRVLPWCLLLPSPPSLCCPMLPAALQANGTCVADVVQLGLVTPAAPSSDTGSPTAQTDSAESQGERARGGGPFVCMGYVCALSSGGCSPSGSAGAGLTLRRPAMPDARTHPHNTHTHTHTLHSPTNTTPAPPPTTPCASTGNGGSTNVGAIVGPIIAVAVVALTAGIFLLHRRRRRAFLAFAAAHSPTSSGGACGDLESQSGGSAPGDAGAETRSLRDKYSSGSSLGGASSQGASQGGFGGGAGGGGGRGMRDSQDAFLQGSQEQFKYYSNCEWAWEGGQGGRGEWRQGGEGERELAG